MPGFYGMSLTGVDHLSKPNPVCQDAHSVRTLKNGWVAAAVADGLGSASCSDIGAAIAASEAVNFVEKNVPDSWDEAVLLDLLRKAYQSAACSVETQAERDGNDLAKYDTTLTCAIYDGKRIACGHAGDGGIIALTYSGEYKLLTEAQKGQAFNETYPLRYGSGYWVFGAPDAEVCALLMMTDGVYDVACPRKIAKSGQPIWIRYVRPFLDMNILKLEEAGDFDKLAKAIENYLVCSKYTTDDMTVVGIINTTVTPPLKAEEYYRDPDWKKLNAERNKHLYPGLKIAHTADGQDAVKDSSSSGAAASGDVRGVSEEGSAETGVNIGKDA
jgi:hypothetical protein